MIEEESEPQEFTRRKRENLSDVSGDAADLFEEDLGKVGNDYSDSQSQESLKPKRLGKKIRREERPDNRKKHRDREVERGREDDRGRDVARIKKKEKGRERERERQRERERIKDKRDRSMDSESDNDKRKSKKHKRVAQERKSVKTQEEQRLDAICKAKADAILQKMKTAADLDIKTNKKGQASCQKLIYVKQLALHLETTSTAQFLIQGDGLQLFEKWLRKYPDGTEPSYNLKKDCFLILLRLPITGDALSRSPGLISLIEKHQSSKQRDLKELADKLNFKWTNIMSNPYDDSD